MQAHLDLTTGKEKVLFEVTDTGVNSSPDGKHLLVGKNQRHGLQVRETLTGKVLWEVSEVGDKFAVPQVGFSPTGRWLTVIGTRQSVIRDTATGKEQLILKGTNRLIFSADDGLLAVAESGGKVQVYDVATGKPTAVVEGLAEFKGGGVPPFVFVPDGKHLLFALNTGTPSLLVWDLSGGKEAGALPAPARLHPTARGGSRRAHDVHRSKQQRGESLGLDNRQASRGVHTARQRSGASAFTADGKTFVTLLPDRTCQSVGHGIGEGA